MSGLLDILDLAASAGSFGLDLSTWSKVARAGKLVHSGIASFTQGKQALGGTTPPPTVEEHKMQEGEFYSFLAYLGAIRQTENGPCILDYNMKSEERLIFPAIMKAMKPGAGKLLMQTTGVSVTTVTQQRNVGQQDGKPVTEKTVETVNRHGPRIVNALTWLAVNAAGATEKDRVASVVAMLEVLGIFTSKSDSAKALGARSADELKRVMGWLDTYAHVLGAVLAIGPSRLEAFVSTPACQQVIEAIKRENDPAQKRPHQEVLQGLLVAEGKRINDLRETRTMNHIKWFLWFLGPASAILLVAGIYAGYHN